MRGIRSPQEFAQARFVERLKYRFYRDPGGVFFYYLFEIWPRRKIFPRRTLVGTITVVHVLDTVLVWAFGRRNLGNRESIAVS